MAYRYKRRSYRKKRKTTGYKKRYAKRRAPVSGAAKKLISQVQSKTAALKSMSVGALMEMKSQFVLAKRAEVAAMKVSGQPKPGVPEEKEALE